MPDDAREPDVESTDPSSLADDAVDEERKDDEGFAALGLDDDLLAAIESAGFEDPTEIQNRAIPALLAGRDVLGQASTGTGKTAAFALPFLQRLDRARREVQVMVLTPTRELCMQVAQACRDLRGQGGPARVVAVYGGQPIGGQMRALQRGAQIVCGTPGRVLDLLERGALDFSGLDTFVLDEADEMLQMGFVEDIEAILGHAPADRPRQMALFSATMTPAVRRIAETHMKDPVDARVTPKQATAPDIAHQVILCHDADRLEILERLIEVESVESALVFVRTKQGCADLAETLEGRGHPAMELHGDMSQAAREQVMGRFRAGRLKLLIATDVAARGLDVDTITHVINYDLPGDAEAYVHRVGRTGRAGRAGVAITLARPGDTRFVRFVQRHAGSRFEKRRPPSAKDVAEARAEALRRRLTEALADDLDPYRAVIDSLVESGLDATELAAAGARLAAGERPLIEVKDEVRAPREPQAEVAFVLRAGRRHNVRPGDIVGVLCNEHDLHRDHIGAIRVNVSSTTFYIAGEAAEGLLTTRKIMIRGRPVPLYPSDESPDARRPAPTHRSRESAPRASTHGGDRPYRGKRRQGPSRSGPHG